LDERAAPLLYGGGGDSSLSLKTFPSWLDSVSRPVKYVALLGDVLMCGWVVGDNFRCSFSRISVTGLNS